jgi:hypothetical protein
VLLVRQDSALEPLGMASAERFSLKSVTGLRADGDDFLSRALRECLPLHGPPPPGAADAAVLDRLGFGGARLVAVLPLVAAGTCYGLLVAETEGDDAELGTISSFMMEAGPALWEALSRERRRGEARRARAGA